jgi:hypothetical protein
MSLEKFPINRCVAPGNENGMKLFLGSSFSFLSERLCLVAPGKHLPNIISDALGIDWIAKQAVHFVLDEIRDPADPSCNNRDAGSCSFEDDHRTVIFERGKNDQRGFSEGSFQSISAGESAVIDPRELRNLSEKGLDVRAVRRCISQEQKTEVDLITQRGERVN